MNEIFTFKGQEVRTVTINNEPYFVGKDVADILGYQNGSRDINRHVDEEDKLKYRFGTSGQDREMTIINESGLYSLILSSKLPQAKEFKRWLKRMLDYGFSEGIDFVAIAKKKVTAQGNQSEFIEHVFNLDCLEMSNELKPTEAR